MRKTYSCEAWPFVQIGSIQFRDGVYSTDDEDVQHTIEGSRSFGVQIRLIEDHSGEQGERPPGSDSRESAPGDEDGEEGTEPAPRPVGRPRSGARQGARSTGNLS